MGNIQRRTNEPSTKLIIESELTGHSIRCQGNVSRHSNCYRRQIVAPLAMLPCSAYGDSHRECARQTGVRAGHLSAISPGGPAGETTDPGRVLCGRTLSPQGSDPDAERPGAGGRAAGPPPWPDLQAALEELRQALPFRLRGIDSDNGSEFINQHLWDSCQAQEIQSTRGRPHKKDDNAHIE
jgi:hypothetical protein